MERDRDVVALTGVDVSPQLRALSEMVGQRSELRAGVYAELRLGSSGIFAGPR